MKPFTMTYSRTVSRCFSLIFGLVIVIGGMATARAQTQTVYNSIPKPLPPNVGSEGPEAYAFSELGDGFVLQGATGGTLGQVTVVLSSWACQSGNWFSGNCVTSNGATFSQSITVNVYPESLVGGVPTPGIKLASITQTFNIPYRPTSDPVKCDATAWFNKKDGNCYHGFATPISVNFSGMHVPIPTNNTLIVTVAYNTTHYGPVPVGESAACYTASAGCPYDSLNISTDSNDGNYQTIGAVLDLNGIFVNYTLPNSSCTGTAGPGLALDTSAGCWAGFHPEIQVQANTNATHHPKGNGP